MAPKNPYTYDPTNMPSTPPSWLYNLQPVDQQASIGGAIQNEYNRTLANKTEDEFQRLQEYLQGSQGLSLDESKQRALDLGLIDEAVRIDQSQRYDQAAEKQAQAEQDKAQRDSQRMQNEANRKRKQDADQWQKIVSNYGPGVAAQARKQFDDPFVALDTLIAGGTPTVKKGKESAMDAALQSYTSDIPTAKTPPVPQDVADRQAQAAGYKGATFNPTTGRYTPY